MGIFISKLFASLFGDREARILVLGLDNAGKTTILCIRVLALLAFTCLVVAGVLFVCLFVYLFGRLVSGCLSSGIALIVESLGLPSPPL
jgi:hypothetical protein